MMKKPDCFELKNVLMPLVIISIILTMTVPLLSQNPTPGILTRGKWWAWTEEFADFVGWRSGYPGYFNAAESYGNWVCWNMDYMVLYTKDGHNTDGWVDQGGEAGQFDLITPNTLVKNYNFSNDPNEPEEYSFCEWEHHSANYASTVAADINFKAKRMVWSLPKYDDFVIEHKVLTNIGDIVLTDFYYGWRYSVDLTRDGAPEFDDEYEWHADMANHREEQGNFIFFDDTEIDPGTGTEIVYDFDPGTVTGDRGDPGNIREANSLDRQLYSPQVYTDNIVELTPNKNGEKRVYQNIMSKLLNEVEGPDDEKWITAPGYSYKLPRMTRDQTRNSWRWCNANQATHGTNDGNPHERRPQFILTIGPYDLGPNESIEIIRIVACGEMDRNISMLGGLQATQNFKEVGITNLKENWAAALELIDAWEASGRTDWNAGITSYPPPMPADAPRVGNDNVLEAEIFVDVSAGTQGFDISWTPIADSYVDPLKGANDVAGYKVYRSEISFHGPWIEIANISKSEADGLVQGGKVVYRYTAEFGIPFRFCVTCYDTDGNESGKAGYTYYAEAAKLAPSNKLSDVIVIPNPFRQVSGLADPTEEKRITFMNIPGRCTIKLFTVAGELVQTIEHDDGFGEEAWGSVLEQDYMLTRFAQNVMPGIYYYYIESHVSGHEGENATGKFAIIK